MEPVFGLLTFYIVLKHDALTDLPVSSETIHQPVGRGGLGKQVHRDLGFYTSGMMTTP